MDLITSNLADKTQMIA